MTLVTRFLAARRDKLLMKLGCWLVCFSLVLGLMLPQQRAEALVAELTMASVAGVAAAYLCACGLPFVTQGMDRDALTSSIQRLINEFLSTELAGASIQDWLGNVWDLAVIAGKLVMGRPLTNEMMAFAQWVAGKYCTQVGSNPVYRFDGDYFLLADGSKFFFSTCNGDQLLSIGSVISVSNSPVVFSSGNYAFVGQIDGRFQWDYFRSDGSLYTGQYCVETVMLCLAFYEGKCRIFKNEGYWVRVRDDPLAFFADDVISADESLFIDRDENLVYVPPGIAAEQGIALDVGAAETMDLDLVLQGVLDDVIAGALTSTMTAAGEEVVDPPVEEEIPDVDNLGLPALGQALTSRFPFSIPWDFFRAVSLLAAPAKAPYFEVDFMEPLADDVGGWQGDTTVILDFSEYAIIGQISRWTSTIGFCLMLAGATKRLIWTA